MNTRWVVTGPESSGKTELSKFLAKELSFSWLKERALDYLDQSQGEYGLESLVEIAKLQEDSIQEALTSNHVIADTDLLNLFIWAEMKFGEVPLEISKNLENHLPTAYILCFPDLPWEDHPYREHPLLEDRLTIFHKHQELIAAYGVPYFIVRGEGLNRKQKALDFLQNQFAHR